MSVYRGRVKYFSNSRTVVVPKHPTKTGGSLYFQFQKTLTINVWSTYIKERDNTLTKVI